MKKEMEELREYVYDLMLGTLDLEECEGELPKLIKNEMEEGSECARICEELYELRMKMEEKLTDQECEELQPERIGDYFYSFAKKMAYKMFEYGYKAGNGTLLSDK